MGLYGMGELTSLVTLCELGDVSRLSALRKARLSDLLCVRPRRLLSCQSGSRSPKWILRAASPLVQALTERHLVSARSMAR